jgi:uncharacterized protein (DUF2147 family)
MKILFCLFFLTVSPTISPVAFAESGSILGRWITDNKNLIVEVYQAAGAYKARIVWASDRTPETCLDDKNPNPALRTRKVIGMEVLDGLTYNETEGGWENGHIYDATSGKTWSASAKLGADETLVVRGFWGFEIFGKSLRFKRYRQERQ